MSRPDETIDAAAAGCQLLLIGPPRLESAGFAEQLDAALAAGGIAGFVLRPSAFDQMPGNAATLARPLRAICAERGVACLIRDDVAFALEIGADGVHLGGGAAGGAASRASLGDARILGVSCGHSRDAAMAAGEAGADYVAFGDLDQPPRQEVYDLLQWWHELFVLPSLAEVATTEDDCARLARGGADFIAADAAVWSHPEGAAWAVRRLLGAITAA